MESAFQVLRKQPGLSGPVAPKLIQSTSRRPLKATVKQGGASTSSVAGSSCCRISVAAAVTGVVASHRAGGVRNNSAFRLQSHALGGHSSKADGVVGGVPASGNSHRTPRASSLATSSDSQWQPPEKDSGSSTLADTRGWWALIVLVLLCLVNQACRTLPFYLVNFGSDVSEAAAMNVALGFGPAEYGVWATLAFSVPFTCASLFAGVLADRYDRRVLNTLAGCGWSACTAAMAFTTSFAALFQERVLLGMFQAVTNPAAFSMISDLFPKSRATTTAIFTLGIYFGTGASSLGAAVDEEFGWRSACLIFAAVSLGCSLLALTVEDPRQESALRLANNTKEKCKKSSESETLAFDGMVSEAVQSMQEALAPTSVRWLFVASTLRFCIGFAILVWLPTVVRDRFPDNVAEFAAYNAGIKAFAGGFASVAGGVLADTLRTTALGERAGLLLNVAASMLAAPVWYMVLREGNSFYECMAFLCLSYLVAESWLGPAVSTLQTLVPADRRGVAQGLFSALTSVGNVAPALIGLLPAASLPVVLQESIAGCYVLSAGVFLAAAMSLEQAKGTEAVDY